MYGVEKIRKIQPSDAAGASTDFGTASSQIPCLMFSLPVAPQNVAGHSRAYTEATKSLLAHEVVLTSAKIMALTGYKIIEDPTLLAQIKTDWQAAVSGD